MPEGLREIRKKLANEHREILAFVDQLARPRPAREVRMLLSKLYERLTEHFRREQNPGGLYETLAANTDEHREMAKALVGEHFDILSQARDVIDQTRAGISDAELSGSVGEFVHTLRQHEEREEAFVSCLLHE